ncbi:FecR family protein, partial [Parabacteroides leei]
TYAYKSEIKKIRQAMNTITVPAGQRVNLTLPDGTNVWLNACSEMKYPAAFTGDKREITLNGEAYFEVTHNADKPFLVQTNKCNIEVLGTKFNVEAYNDSKDFCTSLLEGSVKIVEREKPSDNLILTPNQQATLVNGHLSSEPIADFDLFRWKEGLICFRNMHFKELMTRFEKCYGIHIIIENTNLADYVCSGKFRISDGIDKALSILQKDAQYTFIRSKDDSAIYIK